MVGRGGEFRVVPEAGSLFAGSLMDCMGGFQVGLWSGIAALAIIGKFIVYALIFCPVRLICGDRVFFDGHFPPLCLR